jgi:CheY-like chemotaxis protein
VEDQAESRASLVDILEDLGVAEVFEADDGQHGLQFVCCPASFIDLILCDWNMPIMSGMEFFRAMRERGLAIPFLMITGRGDHNSVMEARSTGVEGYIRKPFSPEQIEARLRILATRMKAA